MSDTKNTTEASSCCGPNSSCCGPSPAPDSHEGISRRQFLARTGAASVALMFAGMPRWVAGSGQVIMSPHLIPKDKDLSPGWIQSLTEPGEPQVYMNEAARTIGMPVGGIGAGQIYLCGDGSLGLWEIFNDHRTYPHGAVSYARRTIPKPVDHGLALYWKQDGVTKAHMLDHSGFDSVGFRNMHPVGVVYYGSENAPVKVTLEGFSPFIPLNAKDSALPATIMMVTVENVSEKPLEIGTASWLENPIGRTAHASSLPGVRSNRVIRSEKNGRISHSVKAIPLPETSIRPAIVIQDFERSDFGDWSKEGTAFGDAPTTGNLPTQDNVKGWEGKGFAASFRQRDSTTGKLTSPEFTIERRFINFIIGGGSDAKHVGIRLLINGEEIRSAGGRDNENMNWASWDVKEFEGQEARLEIYDNSTGGWGHTQVDHVEMADERRAGDGPSKFEDFPDVGTLSWGVDSPLLEDTAAADILKLLGPNSETVKSESDPKPYPLEDSLTTGIATDTLTLQPGDEHTFTHVLAWHFPNTIRPDREAGHYYATLYPDADAVLDYVFTNRERLVNDTFKWRDTYYDSTLPWWLLERMHMTSCCLATGTTMWWKSGRFWAYEGVVCCVGTCTHVYNYVQTTGRLFPELERNLREQQDLKPGVGLEPSGLVGFRHDGKYAADGQCGTVLKVYREHKMSADDSFLKRNWEATKLVMDYAISQDGNADGIMEGSQHNTYDVNFHGPNTFVGALYLAALRAAEEMATELGDLEYAEKLHTIYEAGRQWTESNLWNGEYFKQIVDLNEHKIHQYGDGCLSDQLFGQNWAHQMNLGHIYDPAKVRKTLESIWQYNWAPDLGVYNDVFPAQRVFAEAQEAGLFNCSWPKSEHLDEGVLYRDEVWSGVEYQVASHMIYEGMLTEGLALCRAVHDRYDPAKRNPYNEIECSDFYSRAMASWGVLLALSGFECHGPRGHMAFNPRITPGDFRCAFNTAEGWGTFAQSDLDDGRQWTLKVSHGQVKLNTLDLQTTGDRKVVVSLNGTPLQVPTEIIGEKLSVKFPANTVLAQDTELQITST